MTTRERLSSASPGQRVVAPVGVTADRTASHGHDFYGDAWSLPGALRGWPGHGSDVEVLIVSRALPCPANPWALLVPWRLRRPPGVAQLPRYVGGGDASTDLRLYSGSASFMSRRGSRGRRDQIENIALNILDTCLPLDFQQILRLISVPAWGRQPQCRCPMPSGLRVSPNARQDNSPRVTNQSVIVGFECASLTQPHK